MRTDDFEERLKRVPLRPVPGQWREEILRVASERAGEPRTQRPPMPVNAVLAGWRELIVPCRYAWSGIAALWLVLLLVDTHTEPHGGHNLDSSKRMASERIQFLQEQRRILVELTGPIPSAAAEGQPPRHSTPKPRSERVREMRSC